MLGCYLQSKSYFLIIPFLFTYFQTDGSYNNLSKDTYQKPFDFHFLINLKELEQIKKQYESWKNCKQIITVIINIYGGKVLLAL